MASLLINRIAFTRNVDEALASSPLKENLKEIQIAVSTKRTIAIKALRCKISKLRQQQLFTLVTLFKEQLDVIVDLLGSTKPAQVWSNECRFYSAPNGTVFCKCGENTITVGDHNPARNMLVVTSLSRVVRRAYFQACSAKGYLWLHGPPGTGKTETANDTAAMLGREFRRFDCSATWNVPKLMKYLNDGSKGAVLVFDSFSAVAPDIQRACIDAVAKAGNFAVFTGKSPPSTALAQSYNFSVKKMTVPCYDKIVQVMLSTEGFVDCDTLGTAIHECLQTCRKNCTKQSWYDFGLRAYKSCVAQAGAHGRTTGFANELKIVCNTVGSKLFSTATETDRPVVLAAVRKSFGQDAVIPKAWTNTSLERALPQIVQDVAETRHGVCVIGLPSDKVTACISAIQITADVKTIVVDNFSKQFNKTDHPLVSAMRQASQTTERVYVCLRLVGDCSPDVLSPLHSLLDDNRKIFLENNEVVALPRNMRIIVFAKNCDDWSPATVSRLSTVCGVLSPPVDWKAKYEEAQAKCVKLQEQLDTLHANLATLITSTE